MNAISKHVAIYRAPPQGDAPPTPNENDRRGIIGLLGLNLDAIAECLALLEETRWSPGMPYGLREELGEPLRQAQAAVAAGKEWVKRGIVR